MAVKKAEKTTSRKAVSPNEKKELAKLLFTRNNLSQKEVAIRVSVSEKTMGKWVKEGNWELMRKSLLVTKDEHIRCFLDQISSLNNAILNNDSELKYADTKQADIYVKLTAALKNCLTETGITEIMDVSQMILSYAQLHFPEELSTIITVLDSFVQANLK